MWLNRRYEEPSPTEVECYWKKSKMGSIGSGIQFIYASEIGVSKVKKVQLKNKAGTSTNGNEGTTSEVRTRTDAEILQDDVQNQDDENDDVESLSSHEATDENDDNVSRLMS